MKKKQKQNEKREYSICTRKTYKYKESNLIQAYLLSLSLIYVAHFFILIQMFCVSGSTRFD